MAWTAARAYLGTGFLLAGRTQQTSASMGSGTCTLPDPARRRKASHCWEDATRAVFIRIKFGKLLRDGKGKKERERESSAHCPGQRLVSPSPSKVSVKAGTLEKWVGRGLVHWDCRSPEPFGAYISLYSRKGLGSGANLPDYTPLGDPLSVA